MAYSNTNLLSTVPARWILSGATMTSNKITIEPGGYARLLLTKYDLPSIKESMLFRFAVAEGQKRFGTVDTVALLEIVKADKTIDSRLMPLNNFGVGTTDVELKFTACEYDTAILTIHSSVGSNINSWAAYVMADGDYTDIVDGIKKEIPKLLTNFNYSAIALDTTEKPVASITAYLSQAGELQGHLQVRCVATLACNLVVRIFDNDIQELFTPIEFALKRGYNSISIPHAYVGKRAIGTHTFLVTAQTDTSEAIIDTRGVLYTIDSGYMAEYLADVGFDISDMTLEHPLNESEPTRIFAIGIDDGVANVRSRPYSAESLAVWQPEFSIPNVAKCAIEFDGQWFLDASTEAFILRTQDAPKVVFVDYEDSMYVQYGGLIATKVKLATGVTALSVCRGWRSNDLFGKDQGFIVVYRTPEGIYMRNYCQQIDGTFLWEAPELLFSNEANILHFTVNRLNDYRIAITVTTPVDVAVYYTPRQYVGQGVSPEAGYTSADLKNITFNISSTEYLYTSRDIQTENGNTDITIRSRDFNINMLTTTEPSVTPISIIESKRTSITTCVIKYSHQLVHVEGLAAIMYITKDSRQITVHDVVISNDCVIITHAELNIKDALVVHVIDSSRLKYIATPTQLAVVLAHTVSIIGDNSIIDTNSGSTVLLAPTFPAPVMLAYNYNNWENPTMDTGETHVDSNTLIFNIDTLMVSDVPV